jgi:hypothetical protein
MKKIMFNDKYGLTQAVLDGRKTMTRRIITKKLYDSIEQYAHVNEESLRYSLLVNSTYQVGEVVAIAQSYDCVSGYKCNHDFLIAKGVMSPTHHYLDWGLVDSAGFNNKMFVKAELMPHHIKITNIRVERLRDISNEDCLREGIYLSQEEFGKPSTYAFNDEYLYMNPRSAFMVLIDKVSGKSTWQSNPMVWVYEFELVD